MAGERHRRPAGAGAVATHAAQRHDDPARCGVGETPEVALQSHPVGPTQVGEGQVRPESAVATQHRASLADRRAEKLGEWVGGGGDERTCHQPCRPSAPVPRPGRLTLWVRATRPPALLTSLLPCLAGGLIAVNSGRATWGLLAVAMVAMLFLHAGTNASNDVEDAARGVDGPDKLRNSRVFNTGLLTTAGGPAPLRRLLRRRVPARHPDLRGPGPGAAGHRCDRDPRRPALHRRSVAV